MREELELVEPVDPVLPVRRPRRPRSRKRPDNPGKGPEAAQNLQTDAPAEAATSGQPAPPRPRRSRRKSAARPPAPLADTLPEEAALPVAPVQENLPGTEEKIPVTVPHTEKQEKTALLEQERVASALSPLSVPLALASGELRVPLPKGQLPAALPEVQPLEAATPEVPLDVVQENIAQEGGETPAGDATSGRKRRGRRGGRGKGKSRSRTATAEPLTPDVKPSEREGEEIPAEPAQAASCTEESQGSREKAKNRRRKMFISVLPDEQVEVALVEEGAIHEYYLEMLHQAKTKGNIYKGVIHNIDTNLQAAFVSYGVGKNGFLQIDEIHPEYYLAPHEPMKGKKFPPIQKVLKPGQEVLVQVVKEPTGNKGAFLTTWLSLAGRFLVLTPGQEQIGVSRKVENDEERARLRELINGIDPGEGLGVIVRTVSAGTSKTTLKTDLQYLKRLWKDIRKRGTTESAPARIYQEPGLPERAVRDYLTDDVCEIWVDNAALADSLRETISLLFPRKEDLIRIHLDPRQTLWERFNIQRQLEQIYSREVSLPSGGRLVFDQTEALMAIDINSGKISGKGNFEAMAFKTNLEAAETIARHLKLRDIGGQIVIDFIEMRDKNHIREVEKMLRTSMKNDRARHDVARMSSFGLLEVVRQRTGSSALAMTMEPCPVCGGTGLRRNIEWQALQALRDVDRQVRSSNGDKCVYETSFELGMYLLNHKREHLRELEQLHHTTIEISIHP